MRNLKRVLSMTLAVVMVVAMMVVGAGAASIEDFGDKAEINQTEAVSLMVDLGVLEGGLDGNFSPKGYLNRAALAKITFLVATGQTSWNVYDGTSCPLTDVDSSWAAGAIKYCYKAGYISGNTNGTFSPDGTLETVAVAKTLLCALGFDAAKEGYVNNDAWDINIMDRAREMGLLEGLSNTMTHALITREDACRMAYNALFVKVRTPNKTYYPTMDGKVTEIITGYEEKNYTLGYKSYNLIKVNGTVKNDGTLELANFTTNPATATASASTVGTQLGIGNKFDNALAVDQVGMSVSVYIKADATLNAAGEITALANATPISKAPVVGKANVIATSADGTAIATLVAKKVVTLDSANYILNGAANTDSGVATSVAKKGTVVEFIDTDNDNKAEIVKVTEKQVTKITADPTVTKNGDKILVTVPGVTGIVNADSTKVKGYEGLKKNDVVLYVTIDGVTTIEKAEMVTGKVAGNHTTKGLLIDGKYYLPSDLTGHTYTANSLTDGSKKYDLFLDNGGFVVMAAEVKGEGPQQPEKETGYLVLTDVTLVTKSGDGSFGSESGVAIQAKIVKADGTQQTVWIDSVDGWKIAEFGGKIADLGRGVNTHKTATTAAGVAGAAATSSGTTATTNANFYEVYKTDVAGTVAATDRPLGKFFIVTNKADLTGGTANFLTTGNIYSYTVEKDDHLTLKTLTNDTAATALNTGKAEVSQGSAKFGNANTVFLFEKAGARPGTKEYTTVTGIANIPTATAVAGKAVADKGIVAFVYVTAHTVAGDKSDDLVYIIDNSDVTSVVVNRQTIYTTTVLLNGVEKSIQTVTNPGTLTNGNIYAVTTVQDGVYTLNTTAKTTVTGIVGNAGNVLVIDNSSNAAYRYEDNATAFVVGVDQKCSTASIASLALDANDKVYVEKDADDVIVTLYVLKVTNEPGTVKVEPATAKGVTVTGTEGDLTKNGAKVTNFVSGTTDAVKLTVTVATGTTLKTVTLNGTEVTGITSGTAEDNLTVALGSNTVVVVVEDDNSHAEETFVYSFTAVAP